MLKKLLVCLSLLNIAAYASEDEHVYIPSQSSSLFDESRVKLEVMKSGFFSVPEYQRREIDLNQIVEPQPLDKDGLEAFASVFRCCAENEEDLDEVMGMVDDIPQEQRSQLINSQDDAGDTPLIIASRNENLECVKLLVKKGADIYAKNAAGLDALQCAKSNGRQKVADYLHIQDKLKGLVEHFCSLALDEDILDDMKEIFFSIPEDLPELRNQLINYRPYFGSMNALMAASSCGNLKGVQFLVEHGADVYAVDDSGRDAHSFAEQAGYTYVMDYLSGHFCCLASDKDRLDDMKRVFFRISEKQRIQLINRSDSFGANALMAAASTGNLDGVKLLIERGADIYAMNTMGLDAFFWAERGEYMAVAECLRSKMFEDLSANTNGFIQNKPELFAHVFCCLFTNKDSFNKAKNLLSSIPAEQLSRVIDAKAFLGMNALMWASSRGNLKGVEFLVEHGADIYAVDDKFGRDAYSFAEQAGYTYVMDYLSGHFCCLASDKDRLDDMKRVFFRISEKQRIQLINRSDSFGANALMAAASTGNLDGVKLLIERGADIYAVDKSGRDAYSFAEQARYVYVMDYLSGHFFHLAADKDRLDDMTRIFFRIPEKQRIQVINRSNLEGRNALMAASSTGNAEGVQFLIDHGADIYAVDNSGKDAFLIAILEEHENVLRCLRSKMFEDLSANTNGVIQNKPELFAHVFCCLATNKGPFNKIKYLIDGIPAEQLSRVIDSKALSGMNALILASIDGNLEGVKWLVEHGASIYTVDDTLRLDAYHWAERYGQREVMDYLRSREEVR